MTDDIESDASYLVLKERGSIIVGGRRVPQPFVDLGSHRAADTITVDQMYVDYMVRPNAKAARAVLIHGVGQSGNSYDTTPDGRIGRFEYFVRQEYATYVVDQIGRGRSGFNQAIFNQVGAGDASPSLQPQIVRLGDDIGVWVNFRIGPAPRQAFADTQFPIEAIDAASQRGIPDLNAMLPSPNPTCQALVSLSHQLDKVVLIATPNPGHFRWRQYSWTLQGSWRPSS
ncbi:hypothetical protein M3I54_38930 [Paraburkholderia sp. CNPSo 3274]|uniref:hypothetical protein n=1 Tax=Paraburkholderia sp. CNPSo 3274 TaxID=2940932 RepID=UPI0020B6DFFE|nr:hypothetical protein [Paraburkholderia sp. CNPSo 3274]MCP3712811.1 hypothetical protein [Paraburkholderia sp. CNPSo 3274]